MRLLECSPMSAASPLDVVDSHDGVAEHDASFVTQNVWRRMPAARCGKTEVLRIRHLLRSIAMLDQPRWDDAARGDTAAAIAVAMDVCDPENGPSPLFDLAMSALFACVLDGDPAARLVFANIVRRADWLEHVEAEPVDLYRLMADVLPRRAPGAS